MKAKEMAKKPRIRVDAGIRRLTQELNREDSRLRPRILDAALAGLRLERNPESLELRRDAAQVWAAIQQILSHHLDAEEKRLLPWLEQQERLSPEVMRKVLECHDKLRKLMGSIVEAGAEHLTEAKARDAGRALSGLAVHLDDMIDDEERRLFPTIQKALFEAGRRG
jgi:hemerythrin-like domain-containing protein